jgi:hypothetical protein
MKGWSVSSDRSLEDESTSQDLPAHHAPAQGQGAPGRSTFTPMDPTRRSTAPRVPSDREPICLRRERYTRSRFPSTGKKSARPAGTRRARQKVTVAKEPEDFSATERAKKGPLSQVKKAGQRPLNVGKHCKAKRTFKANQPTFFGFSNFNIMSRVEAGTGNDDICGFGTVDCVGIDESKGNPRSASYFADILW